MDKVQKTTILLATWAMKIVPSRNIPNATSIFFPKPQFKGQEREQFANGASLHKWTAFQMGFYGAPPTVSWPKGEKPHNGLLYCIVLP